MGLHPFNRDKALRKLRFRQHRGQYIKIGTIILSIIIFVAGIIYYSYSKYTVTNKFDVIQTTVGEFSKCKLYTRNQTFTFDYTGAEQTFTPACDGYYKLEAWGAQGGSYNTTYHGGYGAYSIGNISLQKDVNVYINVGGTGSMISNNASQTVSIAGGYNGGGAGTNPWTSTLNQYQYNISGGGATHIALNSGELSSLNNNLNNIFMVASAGGGGQYAYLQNSGSYSYCIGGNGGGINGGISSCTMSSNISEDSISYSLSTQTSPGSSNYGNKAIKTGSFGLGASGYYGGGGGLYGGTGNYTYSGGGSGYINNSLLISSSTLTKHMTCYNCTTSTDSGTYTISNTCTNATATTDCSKTGNGYAKITYLGSSLE